MTATFLQQEGRGRRFIRDALRNKFTAEEVAEVDDAIDTARAAGVDWIKIFVAILPLVLSLFTGGTVDIQAIIALILSLIGK